jgi:hypothetical protein
MGVPMRSSAFRPWLEEYERRETVADLVSAVGLVAAAGHGGLAAEQASPPLSHLRGVPAAPLRSW